MDGTSTTQSKQQALAARMSQLGIREADLVERFVLGSGSGGQKINKTSSCVYLRHGPSGIEVKCQQGRSRELNRFLARRELCERLAERTLGELSRRQAEAEKIRRQKRRRSRRQRARMLDDKRKEGQKKIMRRPVAMDLILAGWLALSIPSLAGSVTAVQGQGQAPTTEQRTTDAGVRQGMSAGQALILGVVEGVTEYLPVSSTGHLLLTQRLMGLGEEGTAKDAADAYAICIQAGAILAVLGLYYRRVFSVMGGFLGRDNEGLRLGGNLIAGFLPAAVIGLLAEGWIKKWLFGGGKWGLWPVVAAWLVGGAIILLADRRLRSASSERRGLSGLTWRMAVGIGLAQCVAMWPGFSRSLATILGGLLVGLGMEAAVEFSFLLGLITLSASTALDALKHGHAILSAYGIGMPVLGFIAAGLSAAAAVKWMVSYLQRHGMAVFGYYRLALGLAVAAMIWWK
jgi:undecaprenyl-diphosphatase